MGLDDFCSTPMPFAVLLVGEMGARTIVLWVKQEFCATATDAACEGRANFTPPKPQTRNKQKDFRACSLFSCLSTKVRKT